MGGSSGSSPQQVTQTTSNLPEYARPYFENLLDRTNDVSQQQYTPYPGQRMAAGNTFTAAGQQMTADIANRGTPDLGAARADLGMAGRTSADLAGYQSGYQGNTFQGGTFGPNAAGYYMSPYMQQVVDRQKDAAVLDFQRGQAGRDDSAIRAGAFGGSRQAIQQGLAQQGLQRQLGDIQAQGSQSAYSQAMQQFNADQARRLQAEQMTDASQQMVENDAARAAGIRGSGASTALAAAQGYGTLASTDQALALQRAQALGQVGGQISATQQQGLDIAYNDFINQRDYDRQNLNFYSGILRGTPVSAESEVRQYNNPNPLNQIAGLGIAGLGAYKAMQ